MSVRRTLSVPRRRPRLLPLEDRLAPAIVSSLADSGNGTLRTAILNAVPGEVITFSTLFSVPRTIALTTGDIPVSVPITIDASAAAAVTVHGNKLDRLFDLTPAPAGAAITFKKLTLTSGRTTGTADINGGGALLIGDESVTLTNCTLTGNSAQSAGGAVRILSDKASLTAVDCSFSSNSSTGTPTFKVGSGGAIALDAPAKLTLQRTTVSGNTASGNGAGIYAYLGTELTLLDSVIDTNTSNGAGGLTAGGAGLYVYGASTIAIRNCTISGNVTKAANSSGGGILLHNFSGTMTVENSTITANSAITSGGGLARIGGSAGLALTSTILAGNTAATAGTADLAADTAFALTGDHNIVGVLDPASKATLTGTGNFSGSAAFPLDAKLAALSFNGGPTRTHRPLDGSPAIDAGANPAGLTTDQRGTGFPRLQGIKTDVGAFETEDARPSATATAPDVTFAGGTSLMVTVVYSDFVGSKLIDAASIGTGDVIVRGPGGFAATASLVTLIPGTDAPSITATYEFTAPGGTFGLEDNGIYSIDVEANQVFDKDTVAQAVPAGTAGSFRVAVAKTFVVTNANDAGPGSLRQAVLDANANTAGAADTITFDAAAFATPTTITLATGSITVSDSLVIQGPGQAQVTVSGNNASRVFVVDIVGTVGTLSLSGLTLTDGKATGDGGAIRSVGDDVLVLSGVTISNSAATGAGGDGDGGAIALGESGSLTLINSTLSGNVADSNGGAVYFYADGKLVVTGSTLSGNTSKEDGGAVYFYGTTVGTMSFTNSTISGNQALSGGGGIALEKFAGSLRLSNCTVTANFVIAGVGGGIVFRSGTGTIELQSTIIALNGGTNGHDISFPAAATVAGNNNLVGITDSGNFTLTGTGNKTGTIAAQLDPLLQPLADNGGLTKTHALKVGSPAIDAGNNAAGLTLDQRGQARNFDDPSVPGALTVDIGAFELQPTAAPPTVTAVTVNTGGNQRSMVTLLKVTFSEAVNFPGGAAAAFQLARTGPGTPTGSVALSAAVAGNAVTLTFAAGVAVPIDKGGSLIDGAYTLTIFASAVTGLGGNLDGNGNGTGGDDYQSPASGPGRLHRLFGDNDGDGDVDAADFAAFRGTFGAATNLAFDGDGDGDVDAADFASFRARFGLSV